MNNTVYALIGHRRHYPGPDNVIRVFDSKRAADRWCVLLECAARDAHFPVTYAELKQDFGWVPDHSTEQYDVVEYTVQESGWDE